MEEKYKNYENLIDVISENEDITSIYLDDADGKYEYKRTGHNNTDYKFIDIMDTDGIIKLENNKSCYVENASYVAIKTYEKDSLKKVLIILSLEGYGLLHSTILRSGNDNLFSKINSDNGIVSYGIENYEIDEKSSSFSIIPSAGIESKKIRSRV